MGNLENKKGPRHGKAEKPSNCSRSYKIVAKLLVRRVSFASSAAIIVILAYLL